MDKKNNTIFLLILIGVILSLKFFNFAPFSIAGSETSKYSEILIPAEGKWVRFQNTTEGFFQPSILSMLKTQGQVYVKSEAKVLIKNWNEKDEKTFENLVFIFEPYERYYIQFFDNYHQPQSGKIIILKGGEK